MSEMDKIFDIANTQLVATEPVKTLPAVVDEQPKNEDEEVDKDFDDVIKNLRNLSEKGNWVLDDLIELAKTSQDNKAYDSVALLIKTLADANKDVLNAYLKRKNVKKKDKDAPMQIPAQSGSTHIEKAIFVGTTADLVKKHKELTKE